MKRRMKRMTTTTLALMGVCSIALAAWFVAGAIEGTGVTHAGKTTATVVPVKVVIKEGVTPTQEEPFEEITIENPAANKEVAVKALHFTITTGSEVACPASNFSVHGVQGFEIGKIEKGEEYVGGHVALVGAGVSMNLIGPLAATNYEFNLKMAANAPESCEGVEVKAKVVVN